MVIRRQPPLASIFQIRLVLVIAMPHVRLAYARTPCRRMRIWG
jgi:hypothetical protein